MRKEDLSLLEPQSSNFITVVTQHLGSVEANDAIVVHKNHFDEL